MPEFGRGDKQFPKYTREMGASNMRLISQADEEGHYMRRHNGMAGKPRKGCKDMWNAFMLDGVTPDHEDIPFCPTTAIETPKGLIAFWDLKTIHKREMRAGNVDYHVDAFAHFYGDDQKFDGPREGVWEKPYDALEILRHCDGFITPDFSTNLDFLDPIRRYNTMRMRAFGAWAGQKVPCLNNVRWGWADTYCYDFAGLPSESVYAIGTVASDLRDRNAMQFFECGLREMVRVLRPKTIIVYGSANYECLRSLEGKGIKVVSFDSKTNLSHGKEMPSE